MSELSKAAAHLMYVHERGYRVLKDGRVKSFTGKIRKLRERHKGRGRRALDEPYLEFCATSIEGKSRGVLVHRLQAYQKFGLRIFEDGLVVRHKNSVTIDNARSNILLGTYSENIMDQPKELRVAKARAAALAKRVFTMEQAREIREAHAEGTRVVCIAEQYGVGHSSIYSIINNQTYKEDVQT